MAIEPTAEQIEARRVAGEGGTPAAPAADPTFIKDVQKRLLGQADIVSSQDTKLEETITESIAGVKKAEEASAARITSEFEREKEFQTGQFAQRRTGELEAQRGFATNVAALRQLDERTEKSLRDLEQRKQELLLTGEATAAERISELQFDAIEFRQKAQQQTFTNLATTANIEIARQQETRIAAQQERQEDRLSSESAMRRIDVLQKSGTLDSLSPEEMAELEKVALLPEGSVEALAKAPRVGDIRTVGDSLVSIDPVTGKTTVLFTDKGQGVSIGGQNVSLGTASVINGVQNLQNMTSTQQGTVRGELNSLGYSSEKAPAWFKKNLRETRRQSIVPEIATKEWNEHRSDIVFGKNFLNTQFFSSIFTEDQLKVEAKKAGIDTDQMPGHLETIAQQYRDAGFSDFEILKLMQK